MAQGGSWDCIPPDDSFHDDNQEAPPHLYLVQEVTGTVNNTSGCSPQGGYNITVDSGNIGGIYPGAGTSVPFQPLVGTDTSQFFPTGLPPVDRCMDFHTVSAELLASGVDDNNVVGACERCGVRVIFPRIPGAFSFERAGAFVGRAMSMDEDDDAGALLAELIILQEQIEKDQRRYKRALEILEIARTTALKHAAKRPVV